MSTRQEKRQHYATVIATALTQALSPTAREANPLEAVGLNTDDKDFDGTLFVSALPLAMAVLLTQFSNEKPKDDLEAWFTVLQVLVQERGSEK